MSQYNEWAHVLRARHSRLLCTSREALVVERLPLVARVPCCARGRATQLIARLRHILARAHLGNHERIRRGRPRGEGTYRGRRVALVGCWGAEHSPVADAAVARLALAVGGRQGEVADRVAHGGLRHPVRTAHGLRRGAPAVRSVHAGDAARDEDQPVHAQHRRRVRGAVW